MNLYSIDAEASVLGGIFEHNELMDDFQSILSDSDFYSAEYRKTYKAILNLKRANKSIDLVNVKKELSEEPDLEDIDELIAFLPEPTFEQALEHAEIIKEYSFKRNAQREFSKIATVITENPNAPKDEILSLINNKVEKVVDSSTTKTDTIVTYKDLVPTTLQKIRERAEAGTDITGLRTGIDEFDKLTGGLQKTDLIIVAGRPSMGKTTLSCNWVDNIVLQGNRAMIFSLEMPSDQLLMRSISSIGGINQNNLRTGQLTELEQARLAAVLEKIDGMDIVIDDDASIGINELRARAIKEHRKKKLDLIMIDYLQLMKIADASNKTNEIGEISRGLKLLAKELNIPIVVLSQLNRTLEQRQDKRPINSDLRDSGAIEQDADLIVFVYRDEVYNPDTEDKGIGEIIIGKQRNGPLGTARTEFVGKESRFQNVKAKESGFEEPAYNPNAGVELSPNFDINSEESPI